VYERRKMTKLRKVEIQKPDETAEDWANLKDIILRLLPPMASLASVSLAGVSLFQLLDKLNAAETIVDEVLAVCAVVLLLCYPTTIWAVRTKNMKRAFFLGRTTLTLFLSAVSLLVYAGCSVILGLSTK
jgi:hypothetical protein